MNNITILSLDQASTTGWAYYKNNKIANFGIIKSEKKNTDYDTRISNIKNEMIKLIDKYTPILVTLEGVHYERNLQTYYKVSKLQGVLINYLLEHQILFDIIEVPKWRGALGIKGRKKIDKKANAIKYVKDVCNIETNEDTAEAICMALYAKENIEIITN